MACLLAGCTAVPTQFNESSEPKTPTATPEPIPEFQASHSTSFPDVGKIEQKTHVEINERREKREIEPVTYDETLADIARVHSRDMAKRDFFEHTNPDGEDHRDRLLKYGYIATSTSEILGIRTPLNESAVEEEVNNMVQSWMDSSGHNSVILSEHYILHGIGVYVTENTDLYWTVIFADSFGGDDV